MSSGVLERAPNERTPTLLLRWANVLASLNRQLLGQEVATMLHRVGLFVALQNGLHAVCSSVLAPWRVAASFSRA
jgi:hypothetical protein